MNVIHGYQKTAAGGARWSHANWLEGWAEEKSTNEVGKNEKTIN